MASHKVQPVEPVVTYQQLLRFGGIVARRRALLGLSRDGLHAVGGPSDTTLKRLEDPDEDNPPSPPRPGTLRKLDEGLQWAPGSAARALAGGQPKCLEDIEDEEGAAMTTPPPDLPVEVNPFGFHHVDVDVEDVQSLMAAGERCFAFLERPDLPQAAREEAEAIRQELTAAIGAQAAAYATEVLERAGGPGRTLPTAIELAYGQFLAVPAAATGPAREDQLYRRWLAKKTQQIEPKLAEKFARRWRSKLEAIHLREGGGR